jgi:hypothetical protein
MQITFDTNNLSGLDKQVLGVLAGGVSAPAAKPTGATKPSTGAKTVKPEPEPDNDSDGATLEQAVALATKMVSNGEAAKVKAALTEVGAKKVSEIPEDKVDEFIAALS